MAGLNIGSGSSATGFGVTFYNTDYNSDYPFMPIQIASGSNAQFTATTGTDTVFDKMLFWQDRDVVGEYDNKIESDTGSYYEGILYFPTQHLMFHSNTVGEGGGDYTISITDTLEVSSGTQMGMVGDLDGGSGGIDEPTLVE